MDENVVLMVVHLDPKLAPAPEATGEPWTWQQSGRAAGSHPVAGSSSVAPPLAAAALASATPAAAAPTPPRPAGPASLGATASRAAPGRDAAPDSRLAAVSELALWLERLRRELTNLTGLQAAINSTATSLAAPPRPNIAPVTAPPAAVSAPEDAAPPAASSVLPPPRDPIFEGRVTVDAGPFPDIPTLTTLQRALEQIPGSRDIIVTGFDSNRAHIELDLDNPLALARDIRSALPLNFAIFETGQARLAINVDGAPLPKQQPPRSRPSRRSTARTTTPPPPARPNRSTRRAPKPHRTSATRRAFSLPAAVR